MSKPLWTHADPGLSPEAAAGLYAATFDPPRKVLDLGGLWAVGLFPGWAGRFRLVGRGCWYLLEHEEGAGWTVFAGPPVEEGG